MTRLPPGRRAFTLVEMLASITIMAIVAGVGTGLIWQGVASCRTAANMPQAHAELSAAMERLTRELRSIGPRAGAAVALPDIDAVAADAIEWDAGDAVSVEGTDLVLVEDGGAPRVLLRNVVSFAVSVYAEDGAEIDTPIAGAACDHVRRVSLTIRVSRDGSTDTLRSQVFIRSLMAGAAP
jgi:prepilin-type N-terminal cleavage/methylation domain-containing protein